MKLSTRIITVILLVASSSGAVYAFSKHHDWGMSPEEKKEFVTERVTRKLDLDNQQQQKFAELAGLVVQIMQEAKVTKKQQVAEIEALLSEPGFNQAQALEMVEQKTRMINEKAPLVISYLAGFLDSLSPAQKERIQQFIRHHEHHRHGHDGQR